MADGNDIGGLIARIESLKNNPAKQNDKFMDGFVGYMRAPPTQMAIMSDTSTDTQYSIAECTGIVLGALAGGIGIPLAVGKIVSDSWGLIPGIVSGVATLACYPLTASAGVIVGLALAEAGKEINDMSKTYLI